MSTTFIDVDGAVKYVSQFTGNSHKAATDMVPAVYFKFNYFIFEKIQMFLDMI